MQRVDNADYYHAKQSCYLCNNPHDGVDTSVQIDYEGVLFLCKVCIGDLARTAGYTVDKDRQPEIDALREELDDSREAQLYAEAIVIGLEAKVKEVHKTRMKRVREAKKADEQVEVTA